MPEHHGCGLRNKYGFNKRVDYKRGEQSVLPTNKPIGEEQIQIKKNL